MQLVYANVYRAVRARSALSGHGIGSTFISRVKVSDDLDLSTYTQLEISGGDDGQAMRILTRLGLMGMVVLHGHSVSARGVPYQSPDT